MKTIKSYITHGNKMIKGLKRLVWGVFCCMVIGSTMGCNSNSRADYLAKSNRSDEAQAEATKQAIIDALEAKDAKGLKILFSKYAVENTVNLDEKIEELIAFYPGCNSGFKGMYNTHEASDYGVQTKVLNGTYEVTNDNQVYYLNFTIQCRNDEEPDKVGLHLIEVMTDEAMPEGFKWKDEEDAPGVYVLE